MHICISSQEEDLLLRRNPRRDPTVFFLRFIPTAKTCSWESSASSIGIFRPGRYEGTNVFLGRESN
jgi:hypothetical protein